MRPHPAVRACYRDAGHILGSAIIELFIGKKLVFSGDLGQSNLPVVADPTPICDAINRKPGWRAAVPALGQSVEL